MILFWIIIIPLIATIIAVFSGNEKFNKFITLISSILVLILSIIAATKIVNYSGHFLIALKKWIALDALGGIILLLVAVVNFTASIFSIGYMKFKDSVEVKKYFINYNLFVFLMLIIPLIQEPNLIWVAVELTTLFSVFLVGFENSHEALEAAWKYVVLTIMGAAIALVGFLILYWAVRQTGIREYTWTDLVSISSHMSPVLLKLAFVFILVGFGAKVGLVPLHTWLPDAHSQAPSPVCALLSGIETTTVLYVILRLIPVVFNLSNVNLNLWLVVFGLVSVGTAAFLLIIVKDYKRLFAFSTIEHMGIILTAVGLGSAVYRGALLQIIAHALTKSFCFYAAGAVLFLFGTRNINSIKGLIKKAPFAGASLLIGALAIAGTPPFALFLSEFSIIKSGLSEGKYVAIGFLIAFICIAFFAIMNHVNHMVFGIDEQDNEDNLTKTLPVSLKITLIIAIIPVIILGVYIPDFIQKLITLAVTVLGG